MAATDAKPTTNAPVADRLKSLRDRLGDPTLARKPWRLGLVDHGDKDVCPAWSVTIAGHAFHRESSKFVVGAFGKDKLVTIEGIIEMLTDDEVAFLRSRVKDYILRWRVKDAYIGEFIDASQTDVKGNLRVALNPETDVPAEPYLSITPVVL